jgi:hypothetical protein
VAGLAGSQGLEWCEPLTFKGREGSGIAGSRTGYADASLIPSFDWEKYVYTYLLFGRLTYDPETSPDTWRRSLRPHFGAAALDAEAALASASRILPLVTVAHHPSASNNYYWPEMYTDMPIVWSEDGTQQHPYVDTPEPRRFGTVSPLDPEVFSSVAEHVAGLQTGFFSGRMSPLDVAMRLDELAEEAVRGLRALEETLSDADPEARRWSIDIAILEALGRFFAGKLRAAVGYELYAQTANASALGWAVEAYRVARRAWEKAAEIAEGAYVADITFGSQGRLRGYWRDRLGAIEADLGMMETRLRTTGQAANDRAVPSIVSAMATSRDVGVLHVPPRSFRMGEDLELALECSEEGSATPGRVVVRYRPMNQSLAFSTLEMERRGARFMARIPAAHLDGRYPLAYAFVLYDSDGTVWRHPGLGEQLTRQPYFQLRPGRVDGPNTARPPAREGRGGSLVVGI